jgi:hypothetical protein
MLSFPVKYQSFSAPLQQMYKIVCLESSLSFDIVVRIVINVTIGEKRIGKTEKMGGLT